MITLEVNVVCDGPGCAEIIVSQPFDPAHHAEQCIKLVTGVLVCHHNWRTLTGESGHEHFCPDCAKRQGF